MRPLDGIVVIDFTQAHAGSMCTKILAEFGAEVIKIERAGVGDLARYWPPIQDGKSGYHAFMNTNKRSVSLNVATEEGKKIVKQLVKEADVVCENFKFGNMAKLGLSYDDLKAVNPKIIYASLSGFGQTGPICHVAGYDLQLQALSGFMDVTGFNDGPPTKVGPAIGDHFSGTYMAYAINLALISREKTGKGQFIDVSILDCLFSAMEASPAVVSLTGKSPERIGNAYPCIAPYDTYKTKDGFVSIGVSTDSQFAKFCNIMGKPELAEDPRFKNNEERGNNYIPDLENIIDEWCAAQSKWDIEKMCNEAKIPCGAVLTVKEAVENPQIAARDMLVEVEDRALGKVKMPGIPLKMYGTPGELNGAPLLGEDNETILKGLGYDNAHISRFQENGII